MIDERNSDEGNHLNSPSEKDRLRALAASLQNREKDSLSYSLEANDLALLFNYVEPGFFIKGDTLTFDSVEIRNQFTAEHYFSELTRKDENNYEVWFGKAIEIYQHEISLKDKASGRFLALCHQDSDILLAGADVIKADATRTFEILHVIEAALEYLENLSLDGLFTLCDAQHENTKNDLASGSFFRHLESRLHKEPKLCLDVLDRMRSDITDTTASLYVAASISWSQNNPNAAIEHTLEDAKNTSPLLSSNALWVLGRFVAKQCVPNSHLTNVVGIIRKNAKSELALIRKAAIFAIASGALYVDLLADHLTELVEQGDHFSLFALSDLLFREDKKVKDHPYRERWVISLAQLPNDAKGALDNFDWVLNSLLKEEQYELVLSCVERWLIGLSNDIANDRIFDETLDSTFRAITQNQNLLEQLITEWLMSENSQLVSAVAGTLRRLSVNEIKKIHFSRSIVDGLDDQDLIILIRRMLGVVINDDQILSLTLSLLNTRDAKERTFNLVGEVLSNEIGIDYPDLTIKYLETLKAKETDQTIHVLCDEVISSIKGYLKALKQLPRIFELKPSPRMEDSFAKMRAKMINKAQEKANEKSIIRHIASVVTLKAGRASFSSYNGEYTEAVPLHSFTYSVTLPRRHIIDAIGYEAQLLLYRISKRDVE